MPRWWGQIAGGVGLCLMMALLECGRLGAADLRNIETGWEIPTENYADQPYVVQTDDGAWLCVVTTGSGHEGAHGQHVVTLRSTDRGRTWSDPVDVEPADGPEASYAVMLKGPNGRVYVFYNHNTDDLRRVKADPSAYKSGYTTRVDTQGYFVFKYSDDQGRTWSKRRYPIPVREFQIDRENPYGGKVRFFWNVGKPFIHDGTAYVTLHKVGRFGRGFLARSEGVLLASDDLLTKMDPSDASWRTLPDGDIGLRAPAGGGPIAEEQNVSVLSDGSFLCVYRTVDGHPACTYSRDRGRTWDEPKYMCYADGRPIKHPRAANFVWKCRNGKYLYWFHNHGGRSYNDRNPAWLCGGVEVDSPRGKIMQWSQPEIVLYDRAPRVRMGYPDLIEDDSDYFLTETQKTIARVHAVDRTLIEGLWGQFEDAKVATRGCVLSLPETEESMPGPVPMPSLPNLTTGGGFAIECWVRFENMDPGQILLDSRTSADQGLVLQTSDRGAVEVVLNDGQVTSRWESDPDLQAGRDHHIVVNVDGGPGIVTFIIDGRLCDGGQHRQFGWGRLDSKLRHANGAATLRLSDVVRSLRIYARYLRTSEAVGNYRVEAR